MSITLKYYRSLNSTYNYSHVEYFISNLESASPLISLLTIEFMVEHSLTKIEVLTLTAIGVEVIKNEPHNCVHQFETNGCNLSRSER